MLINPGGPGGSGVNFFANPSVYTDTTAAGAIDFILQGKYDLVSFDPRGVKRTVPALDCWNSAANRNLNRVQSGNAIGNNLDSSELSTQIAWRQLDAEVCANNPDTAAMLPFIGTTAVARDMRLMYRYFGDKKLNFWGFSYGTALGSIFAEMFPDEVRRVIIDSVMDVPAYLQGNQLSEMTSAEAALTALFEECIKAGAKACPLGRRGSSGKELFNKYTDLIQSLKVHPWPVVKAQVPQLLTAHFLLQVTHSTLYKPSEGREYADLLDQIFGGDAVSFINQLGDRTFVPSLTPPTVPATTLAFEAIFCGDTLPEASGKSWSLGHLRERVEQYEKVSKLFVDVRDMQCRGTWKARSTEWHHGNFTSKTAFPILVLGNQYDPATPLVNARLMASKFPSAVLVERLGYGHSTITSKSKCINKVIRNYFLHGKVTDKGTICGVDAGPFDEPETLKAVRLLPKRNKKNRGSRTQCCPLDMP